MLPVYRFKDTLIHGLHPLTALMLTLTFAVSALLLENPVYTAVICAGVISLIILADVWGESRAFIRVGLVVALFVVIINPLVNHQGSHVLIYGPRLPLWGPMDVTLEAIAYGFSAALKIFTVIAAFGLMSTILNPDDLLGMLSRFSFRTSLSAALAVRLYPSMVTDAREIEEVQLARGMPLKGGGRWSRAQSRVPLWFSLFQGSLDRASAIAESMSARGFGNGKRTRLSRRLWRPRDILVLALSAVVLAGVIAAVVLGKGGYSFFPTLDNPLENLSPVGLAVLAAAPLLLVILGRSWKRWHWWRSRI
ncbi:MAG: energy-coupling factor transporter transmembrane component T [Actinomycetota bacterium]|nr:energy-coupling factor transporter transmembrane component T [Actinomycetota bacterium]